MAGIPLRGNLVNRVNLAFLRGFTLLIYIVYVFNLLLLYHILDGLSWHLSYTYIRDTSRPIENIVSLDPENKKIINSKKATRVRSIGSLRLVLFFLLKKSYMLSKLYLLTFSRKSRVYYSREGESDADC